MKRRPLALLASSILLACFLTLAGAWAMGWWVDFSEEPRPSDMIVVLCGSFTRPFFAADLYKQGLAPEVWHGRPRLSPGEALLLSEGLPLRSEDDVVRAVLVKRGVPPERIRAYGDGILNTLQEARAFREAARPEGKKVLVVTSRWHARRARLIFGKVLAGAEVRVAATPYDPFTRRWWTRQETARETVLETAKSLFYLLGGEFKG
jgi:uncharacterized SAM-binding protein YcdF (DUF218 family)